MNKKIIIISTCTLMHSLCCIGGSLAWLYNIWYHNLYAYEGTTYNKRTHIQTKRTLVLSLKYGKKSIPMAFFFQPLYGYQKYDEFTLCR